MSQTPLTEAQYYTAVDLLIRRDIAAMADDFHLGYKGDQLRALPPLTSLQALRDNADEITRALAYGHSRHSTGKNRGSWHHDDGGISAAPGTSRLRSYAFSHIGIPILDEIDYPPDTPDTLREHLDSLLNSVHRYHRRAAGYDRRDDITYSESAALAHAAALAAEVTAPVAAEPVASATKPVAVESNAVSAPPAAPAPAPHQTGVRRFLGGLI